MKYNIYLFLISLFAFFAVSCSNENNEDLQDSNEVKVYFVYSLDTTVGDLMSRSTTNADVFNEFYAKIQSGDLVASSYELVLTEVNTGVVYKFKGNWGSHNIVTLQTGIYDVEGVTTAEGDGIQDKCSFTFTEKVEVTATSSVITLHANYDCFMLIFNDQQIVSLENFDGENKTSFFTFGNYKYAFVNNKLFVDEQKDNAYILGKYSDDAEFMVFTGKLNFEKGKYYVYNSVSNGFDVPPMEEGTATDKFYLETYILDKTTHPYYIGGMMYNCNENIVKKGLIVSVDEDNLYYDTNIPLTPPYLEMHNDENRDNGNDDIQNNLRYKIIDCTKYGLEQFNVTLNYVLGNTKYYIRAFALNDKEEVFYGNIIEIVTENFNRNEEAHHIANVFYAFEDYTLFDLATDEYIDYNNDGYFYSTNESSEYCGYETYLGYNTCYKFKTEWNYRLWYSNKHVKDEVAGIPLMEYKDGKLHINKQASDADKNVEIYYSINENGRRPETFTQKYETPLEIKDGDTVYCYAISEDGYISYTNVYKK